MNVRALFNHTSMQLASSVANRVGRYPYGRWVRWFTLKVDFSGFTNSSSNVGSKLFFSSTQTHLAVLHERLIPFVRTSYLPLTSSFWPAFSSFRVSPTYMMCFHGQCLVLPRFFLFALRGDFLFYVLYCVL